MNEDNPEITQPASEEVRSSEDVKEVYKLCADTMTVAEKMGKGKDEFEFLRMFTRDSGLEVFRRGEQVEDIRFDPKNLAFKNNFLKINDQPINRIELKNVGEISFAVPEEVEKELGETEAYTVDLTVDNQDTEETGFGDTYTYYLGLNGRCIREFIKDNEDFEYSLLVTPGELELVKTTVGIIKDKLTDVNRSGGIV